VKWQKTVEDKGDEEKKRVVGLQEAHYSRRDYEKNQRDMAEREADERALDQLRL